MPKSVKVIIGNKEFTLKGEDEVLIDQAAHEVDSQLGELNKRNSAESPETLSILAALNIAEKYYKGRLQDEANVKFVIDELNKMTEYIETQNSVNSLD